MIFCCLAVKKAASILYGMIAQLMFGHTMRLVSQNVMRMAAVSELMGFKLCSSK
jgi:hypothetical protein